MSSEADVKFEIGHVLFIDIVGYSIRPTDEQQALVDRLNKVVRSSDEFNRAALYLGVFVVVTSAAGLGIDRWATGLGIGIGTIAAVALVSRLLPGSFPAGDLPTFLPGSVTRLSFPLGYWNGLAIFLALTFLILALYFRTVKMSVSHL